MGSSLGTSRYATRIFIARGHKMSTKSILVETLIAGFLLLLVLILFVFIRISDEELYIAFKYFNSVSVGASAILLTIIFGLSYILGSLSHRIGADLSDLYYILRRKTKPQVNIPSGTDDKLAKEFYNKWLAKSFYRTLMLSAPIIILELVLLDNKLSSGQHFSTIIIIGIATEVVVIIAFFTQRNDYLESGNKISDSST